MSAGFPYEIFSNIAAIILVIILGYRYFLYKKNVDVLKGLDSLKDQGQLSPEDIHYIKVNEREYKEKVTRAEQSTRLANPIFIVITVLIAYTFTFQETLIHLNVVVVAFLFMQVDKIHKKNIHTFLFSLKREIKKDEKAKEEK